MLAEISCTGIARLVPRHDDFGEAAGVDVDELVRPDGLDDTICRHRASGAGIGRAEDRNVGGRAGILDEIADADDVCW